MAGGGGGRGAEERRRFLDHLESYLARRDGVDKLLKISRYAARVLLAAPASAALIPPPVTDRLRSFESSVGTSRKAFRLGKFVQDVNALLLARRRFGGFHTLDALLYAIAYGGEGLYYFVEQFVWLAKTGLIDKRFSKSLGKLSAWTEFIGYFGSVVIKARELSAIVQRENRLLEDFYKKADGDQDAEVPDDVAWEIKSLETKRFMKTLSIVQDFSDALLALSDIRDGRGRLSNPFLLASSGLVSALISTHKNWLSA